MTNIPVSTPPSSSHDAELKLVPSAGAGGGLAYRELPGSGLAIVNPLSYGATVAGIEDVHGQLGFLEAMNAGHQLVWFDQRGAGASASAGLLTSWEQRGADLWDVADAAGIERAVLYGVFDAGHTIVHAAAQRPDRVLGLIFNRVPVYCTAVPGEGDRSGGVSITPRQTDIPEGASRSLRLMELYGISERDAQGLARVWDDQIAPEATVRLEELLQQADLRPLIAKITAPVLIISPRRHPELLRWGEALAEALPASRLVRSENGGEALGAIHAFLSILSADVGNQASRLPASLSTTMTAGRRAIGGLRRIVVPVNASLASARSVELACRLGEAQRAEILLVNVIAVPRSLPLDHPLPEATYRGERALTLGRAIVAEHGMNCTSRLLTERSAAGAVVRLARDEGADLIVMGAGGMKEWDTDHIGRTAAEVLRRAPCEVLLDREAVR